MAEKRSTAKPDRTDVSVARIATIAAGATIGSAAIAAAVLFATRRREDAAPATKAVHRKPAPSRHQPETD